MYHEIKKCRICGSEKLHTVVDLGNQKLTGVFPLLKDEEQVEMAPLEMVKCVEGCGLVQLRHSCNPSSMYGDNYGYRSGLNSSMVRHLTDITGKIKDMISFSDNDIILDIGSNDGTLLKSYALENVRYIGMDPSARKFRKYYTDNITVVEDFFSAERFMAVYGESAKARVVTSIAMFYDLESPIDFAQNISDILDPEGVWVFEQSYLPFMVETKSFDTICQEHLEYYTLKQIVWILKEVGMKVVDVVFNDINGGSFRITAAKVESGFSEYENVSDILNDEINKGYDDVDVFEQFTQDIETVREQVITFLREKKNKGELVYGYGASTKGNVLLQYFGITEELLPAIAEVNTEKYGHVTPGTRIPIISEEQAKEDSPAYFFVLPWHFKENILEKNHDFMEKTGCHFVFPLPEFNIK